MKKEDLKKIIKKRVRKKAILKKPVKKTVKKATKKKSKVGRPRKNKKGQIFDLVTGKFRTGRPAKITDVVLRQLAEAFVIGASDKEACAYAGITPSTLYKYQEKNPKFSEQKECLKNIPTFKARKKIVEEIEKDTDVAKWWITRKKRREFSEPQNPKLAVQINNNNSIEDATDEELDDLIS